MDIFFRIAKIQLEMTEKVDKFQQNLAILSIYETSFNEISVYAKTPFPFVFERQQPQEALLVIVFFWSLMWLIF